MQLTVMRRVSTLGLYMGGVVFRINLKCNELMAFILQIEGKRASENLLVHRS